MKIIYIHQYFNTPKMNGSTRSYEFARRLVKAGHSVTMITSDRSANGNLKIENIQGIEVYWMPVHYSNHLSFMQRVISFFIFMIKATVAGLRQDADIVLATSTPLSVIIPGYIISKFNNAKLIFEVRDLWPDVPIGLGILKNRILIYAAKKLEEFAYAKSDHIIALSEDMRARIIEKKIASDKVSTITNVADLENFYPANRSNVFRKYGLRDQAKVLVYSGTFGMVNNVEYLVDLAFELRSRKDFQIFAIGSGREFLPVRDHAIMKGVLNKNFFLHQAIPKEELYTLLSAADMACSLTVDNEVMEWNSANKFFDGLAAGCLFFTNYGGWQAKVLSENHAGVNLTRDIKNASKIMEGFLDDELKIKIAQKNARLLAEKKFSIELMQSNLETIMYNLFNGSNVKG